MNRQPAWDKYEVALLIEAYIRIKADKTRKLEILQKLSNKLRTKAVNNGAEVSDTFRNLNGMQWQLGFIDCAFANKSFGTHSPSKMFRKMVDMYQNERSEFDVILQQAEEMVTEKGEDIVNKEVTEDGTSVENDIVRLVSSKFVYGFRINSVIDMMKLKTYADEQDIYLLDDEDEIRSIIRKNGILLDDKVYIKSESMESELSNLVDEVFKNETAVIYYERLLEVHRELMEKLHITSEQVLKETLIKIKPRLEYAKNYFTNLEKTTEDKAVTEEILRVWGDKAKCSVEELSECLRYVPEEKIRFYLSSNLKFVWVTEGVYTNTDRLVITDQEIESVKDFVVSEIERRGFSSISEFPLGDTQEENYELTELAIRYSIYNKYLSHDYYLKGKIITTDRSDIDAVSIMKQICSEKEEYDLDDAMDDVGALIGINDRRIAYLALYDVMIRVSEQRFVADNRVHFDVETIDKVLDSFARDGFIAIKEITTFALFPLCGQPWTHYLLESYCYRYSKKYRYRTNLFNGRNAGAIVAEEIDWDYFELLSQAAARSKIELEPENIGLFLYETGYMARSKFNMLSDIAERAKQIREERV